MDRRSALCQKPTIAMPPIRIGVSLWLDAAAEQGQLITCNCRGCRRVVRYLAADLLPILGPGHRIMLDPPFPCGKCGHADAIEIKLSVPVAGDYGHLDVRRPAGIRQTQTWRTVKLGDDVANRVMALPDRSSWFDTMRRRKDHLPPKLRGE